MPINTIIFICFNQTTNLYSLAEKILHLQNISKKEINEKKPDKSYTLK